MPTLKIILSSTGCGSGTGGLCIEDLSPGTANDSNILTITVLNNTGNGYTLTANVGDNTTNSGRFNTSDLVHTDTNITNKFTSLATNANIANNTDLTDSTWGYSYKDETLSNPSWSNYSGLPLYSATTPATLKTSYSPATSAEGDNIKFKIAAKSASNQASGEYNNVINFMITSQPIPVTLSMAYENAGKQKHNGYYKLQDMNQSICNATEVLDEGSQMQAIDIRDNKVYWITKLQDGKCWMTQNLDLNLSTSTALTNADTDLNTVSSWTPMRSTINAVTDENTAGAITGFAVDNNTPYSIDTGDYYWRNTSYNDISACNVGTSYNSCDYLTKPDNTWKNYFSITPYASNGAHGHVGNFYNWSALVASNDTSGYTSSTYANVMNNPPNSICPKGWRLPTVSNDSYAINGTNEYARLANLYIGYSGNEEISAENLWNAPTYWVLAGYVQLIASRPNQILYSPSYNGMLGSSTVNNSTMNYGIGWSGRRVVPEYSDYSRA